MAPDTWQVCISIFFAMDQNRPGPSASLLGERRSTLDQAHEAGFALGMNIVDGLEELNLPKHTKFSHHTDKTKST